MNLSCKRCGAAIPAADVNLDRMVAKCSACHAVFAFDDQLDAPSPKAMVRAPVALPEGWSLVENDEAPFGGVGYREPSSTAPKTVTIRWRWFKVAHLFLLFFAIFWCGFLVFWYSTAAVGGAPLMVFVFPVLHVAVGIGISYSAVAKLLNSTTLVVGDGKLSIVHHPIPWRGSRTLAAEEVKQLYCVEKTQSTKNGTSTTYSVKAQRRGGDEIELLKGLDDASQALFIEQKVEQALGIDDVPVVGELHK